MQDVSAACTSWEAKSNHPSLSCIGTVAKAMTGHHSKRAPQEEVGSLQLLLIKKAGRPSIPPLLFARLSPFSGPWQQLRNAEVCPLQIARPGAELQDWGHAEVCSCSASQRSQGRLDIRQVLMPSAGRCSPRSATASTGLSLPSTWNCPSLATLDLTKQLSCHLVRHHAAEAHTQQQIAATHPWPDQRGRSSRRNSPAPKVAEIVKMERSTGREGPAPGLARFTSWPGMKAVGPIGWAVA